MAPNECLALVTGLCYYHWEYMMYSRWLLHVRCR